MDKKYIFGPVPSRRFGMSLGIDVVPPKVCTIDCVYCECGRTNNLTVERQEYSPADEIIAEIDKYLPQYQNIDYVTITGSGEPTLNNNIKKIIHHLKSKYPQHKIAILTNGTLLYDKDVRDDISEIDLAKISIDAIWDTSFQKVNRPCKLLDNNRVIDGIEAFAKEFKGTIWIEVFIIHGINDTKEELASLKDILTKINPAKIHINSLDRVGDESWVEQVSMSDLESVANSLAPLPVEIIKQNTSKSTTTIKTQDMKDLADEIISILKRRPLTIEDVTKIFPASATDIPTILQHLVDNDKVKISKLKRGDFFVIK